MTQACECRDPDGYRTSSYSVSAQEGQPKPHAGLSCGDLLELGKQSAPMPPATSGLRQPAAGAAKPDRSEAAATPFARACGVGGASSAGSSPRERGAGASTSSSSLDQYNSMLPDNPVQQLPLLPTTASHTAATVRVAAWLLGAPAGHNDAVGAAEAVAAAASDAPASLDGGASDTEALLADLDRSASGGLPPLAAALPGPGSELGGSRPARPHSGAAALPDADGYLRTTYYCQASRRSLDGFLSSSHGNALNNYVAALY